MADHIVTRLDLTLFGCFDLAALHAVCAAGMELAGKKYITRLDLRMQLPKGSSMDFWIQYDSDGQWRHSGHLDGKGLRTFLLPIRPCRCDHLQFRMTGKGEIKLYGLTRVLEAGSDA